jgi:hypothetical protein
MGDKDHMMYVEVIYLSEGIFKGRKFIHYPEKEAESMYLRTTNKMVQDKIDCLVTLRKEDHTLLKSFRNK